MECAKASYSRAGLGGLVPEVAAADVEDIHLYHIVKSIDRIHGTAAKYPGAARGGRGARAARVAPHASHPLRQGASERPCS